MSGLDVLQSVGPPLTSMFSTWEVYAERTPAKPGEDGATVYLKLKE
jgi:hypothetical protein